MMLYTKKRPNGKISIKSKETFCVSYNQTVALGKTKFDDLFSEAERLIKTEYPNVSDGALSKVRGDWYEWLLALLAYKQTLATKNLSYFIKLPNITRFDLVKLYTPKLYSLVEDLRVKLKNSKGVNLVTSNPDFAIIERNLIDHVSLLDHRTIGAKITPSDIDFIDDLYKNFINKCDFHDITGFAAVKVSFRPDRRLQIPHEGSLVKAIYAHIQTRLWDVKAKGIQYHAVSMTINNPDKVALKTVATHSIVTAVSTPEPAVDSLREIKTIKQANQMFNAIL